MAEESVIDSYMQVKDVPAEHKKWYSADTSPMVLEGFHWRSKGGPFRRLPEKTPQRPLPDRVDILADHTAGGCLRFRTNSDEIFVKASLVTENNTADIMTYGRIGFDIYEGPARSSSFAGVTRLNFDTVKSHQLSYCVPVWQNQGKRKTVREFTLFFPLYAKITSFELGLDENALILPPSPRDDDAPVVVYGTSIQQGCCASRPGTCSLNRLSRMLNRPVVNLGFSGSGHGEPGVARVIATVRNPAMFILDYDSNSTLESLEETLPLFTDILREAHPDVPIMTISRMPYPGDITGASPLQSPDRMIRTNIHLENMARLQKNGDRNIHFFDGLMLYGSDFAECTVDSCHPNDLGFYRISQALAPEIGRILSEARFAAM